MNRRGLISKAWWMAAALPLCLVACVDDSYDLSKDIDMTVTIGGNLTVPGSYTEEFTLDDIMDLDDESIIQPNENGDYELSESSSESTDVEIEPVEVTDTESEETRTPLQFDTPSVMPGYVESRVEDVRMRMTAKKEDVTEELIELHSATVDLPVTLTAGFESNDLQTITLLKGFTLEMRMEGQEAPNNLVYELEDTENFRIVDGQPQTIELVNDRTIERGQELRVPIRLKEIRNLPEGHGLYAPGKFNLEVNIISNGWVRAEGGLADGLEFTFINHSEVEPFYLESVTGVFDPEVDINVEPVVVNDVPDFLNDGGNNLDLKNPYIKISFSNETPLDINLTANLVRMKGGVQDYRPIRIGSSDPAGDRIIIRGGEEGTPTVSTYYLSRERMDVEGNIVLGDDIYNLVRTIPDEIVLQDIEAKSLRTPCTVMLGRDGAKYQVETNYEINAALQFGEDLKIVYKDTIRDWHSDVEDITIKKVFIEMDAYNGIPLNFKLDKAGTRAIDIHGNTYPNVAIRVVRGDIKAGLKLAGGNNSKVTQSGVELELTCESGDMRDLDGLIIQLTADSQGLTPEMQNAALNERMTLQLRNIRLRIEGGLTVDLN